MKQDNAVQDRLTETKLGTKWVGKGEGATVGEIEILCERFILSYPWQMHMVMIRLCQKILNCLRYKNKDNKTNLALTGEPLTDEDLKRIAECE